MSAKPLSAKDWNIIFRIITGFNLLCSLVLLLGPVLGRVIEGNNTFSYILLNTIILVYDSPVALVSFLVTVVARMLFKAAHPDSIKKHPAYSWSLISAIIFLVLEGIYWILLAAMFIG